MKASPILVLIGLAMGSAIEQRDCSGNSCNLQISGTDSGLPALTSRSADCASFLRVVVTPKPRTVTYTSFVPPAATPQSVVNLQAAAEARQVTVTPSAIPTYASSCVNKDEYSSACNCLGVNATTTTVRPSRTTVTVTATATDCLNLAKSLVPSCAHACFSSIAPTFNCTGIDDLACECANFEPLGYAVTPCVEKACTHQQVEAIFPAAQVGCNCYSAANAKPSP